MLDKIVKCEVSIFATVVDEENVRRASLVMSVVVLSSPTWGYSE